jgi:hypothetical protein
MLLVSALFITGGPQHLIRVDRSWFDKLTTNGILPSVRPEPS